MIVKEFGTDVQEKHILQPWNLITDAVNKSY
jgi:hypothetical protein